MLKKCAICGLNFKANSNAQKICSRKHYTACPICGASMIWNSTKAIKPCSAKCSAVLRKRTMQNKYNVDNARLLRRSTKINHYSNLKYIRSLDETYAANWMQHGVDVWNCAKASQYPDVPLVTFSGNLETYVIKDEVGTAEFFRQCGVNRGKYIKRKGITVGLVNKDVIYQAIRIEQSSIKGFDCQLTDYGTCLGNRRSYSALLDTAANLYGLDTAICCVDDHCDVDVEMKEMGFIFRFNRPGEVWWDSCERCKKTDDIDQKLSEGHEPVVHPVRKVYDTILFHF